MKLRSLAEIQNLLQAAIRSRNNSEHLLDVVVEKPPLSIPARLKIYQDAYRIRLQESLRDDFQRVKKSLDGEIFEAWIGEYIDMHPSFRRDLAEYSGDFPDFLKSKDPNLFELAMRDWLQILTETAGSPQSALSAEEVQQGAPFCIRRHTSVQIAQSVMLASHLSAGEVQFIRLNECELGLLQFLELPRSLEQLESFAQNHFAATELATLIAQWLKSSVLYCEKIRS